MLRDEDSLPDGVSRQGTPTGCGNKFRVEIKKDKRVFFRCPSLRISDCYAAGRGFEPRLPGPEPGVLPLDDPAVKLQQKIVKITKPVK